MFEYLVMLGLVLWALADLLVPIGLVILLTALIVSCGHKKG